jgi:hypothetical protein
VDGLFVALLIGFPTLGLLTRRWIAVLLPIFAWPTYYIGLNQEWWGLNGTGDGWQYLAVIFTAFGAVTTAPAVVLGQHFASRFARPS